MLLVHNSNKETFERVMNGVGLPTTHVISAEEASRVYVGNLLDSGYVLVVDARLVLFQITVTAELSAQGFVPGDRSTTLLQR